MSAGKRILLADGSPAVRERLRDVLEQAGYTLSMATDGIDAVQRAYNESPDLVVLDIILPRMNGYQVCRLLKNDPAVAYLPIVMLTSLDSRSDEFWCLQTGANAFLNKHVEADTLLSTVERALQVEPSPHISIQAPGPEEILSKVSALLDRELYSSTVERFELKAILHNLSEGIFTVDTQGFVTAANPALCRMVQKTEAELVDRSCLEALGSPAGDDTLALLAQVLSGDEAAPRDSTILSRSGQSTPVSITVAPLRDYFGNSAGCVYVALDIARRKEIEHLYEKLSMLNQLKNDLSAMIVHDLRTPLTSFIGGLHTLENLGPLNEDQREFLHVSINGGLTLLGMINDLLDISTMEEGLLRLDRQELDASQLAERAVQQVKALSGHKDQTLTTDVAPDLPPLRGDEDKLLRTLVNLLGNSIKFTREGGAIHLAARRAAEDNALLFQVSDTGEGIPTEAFERIFEKFGQVDERVRHRNSTGLGLTFCKMMVEAHGGRIWVESQVGQGSTFSFTVQLG